MIELRNVSKTFGDGVPIVALADVDLKVDAGEFVVVLGPSGSGKTTLLNMIGALDTPSGGSIVVDGTDISGSSRKELFEFRRATVSFIFQSFNIFPGLTAAENVQFGADAAARDGVDPHEAMQWSLGREDHQQAGWITYADARTFVWTCAMLEGGSLNEK